MYKDACMQHPHASSAVPTKAQVVHHCCGPPSCMQKPARNTAVPGTAEGFFTPALPAPVMHAIRQTPRCRWRSCW